MIIPLKPNDGPRLKISINFQPPNNQNAVVRSSSSEKKSLSPRERQNETIDKKLLNFVNISERLRVNPCAKTEPESCISKIKIPKPLSLTGQPAQFEQKSNEQSKNSENLKSDVNIAYSRNLFKIFQLALEEKRYATCEKEDVKPKLAEPIKESTHLEIFNHPMMIKKIRKMSISDTNSKIKGQQCSCKNSQCLKFYCECFKEGRPCVDCECRNCANELGNALLNHTIVKLQAEKERAIVKLKWKQIKASTPETNLLQEVKPCNCKNSGCVKGYCDCYRTGKGCGDECRCQGCRNSKAKLTHTFPKETNSIVIDDIVEDSTMRLQLLDRLSKIKVAKHE